MKKTLIAVSLSLLSTTSFALEFLGQTLENTPKSVLHNLLVQNGGETLKHTDLTSTYSLSGSAQSDIPYATWAKVYYAPDGKFVGLQIGFPYDKTNYINVRRALAEKYGTPKFASSFSDFAAFKSDYFSGKAIWNFKNKTSIEYDSRNMGIKIPEEISKKNRHSNTSMAIFYRHEARKKDLINALKEQHYKSEEKKIKNVF